MFYTQKSIIPFCLKFTVCKEYTQLQSGGNLYRGGGAASSLVKVKTQMSVRGGGSFIFYFFLHFVLLQTNLYLCILHTYYLSLLV